MNVPSLATLDSGHLAAAAQRWQVLPIPMADSLSTPAASPSPALSPEEGSDAALLRFLEHSPAALVAAGTLRVGAEVGVSFADVAGNFRFVTRGGKPFFERSAGTDPDFDLRLAPGAVRAICSRPDSDIGDLGVAFFEHIIASEPEDQIRVILHSGLVKLTLRGWLGVLARGGPKVVGWMAQKGLRGPGAVASALSRLRR